MSAVGAASPFLEGDKHQPEGNMIKNKHSAFAQAMRQILVNNYITCQTNNKDIRVTRIAEAEKLFQTQRIFYFCLFELGLQYQDLTQLRRQKGMQAR